MANYYTPFSLRVTEDLLDKIKFIATVNKRSANKEIEFALEKYVKEYEQQNGKLDHVITERSVKLDKKDSLKEDA